MKWLRCLCSINTTIISWARRERGSLRGFDVQIWLLSRATGSVSSGDVSGLTSMVAKRAKLRATILLPLETRKVARGNTEIWTSKLFNELSSRLTQLIIVESYGVIIVMCWSKPVSKPRSMIGWKKRLGPLFQLYPTKNSAFTRCHTFCCAFFLFRFLGFLSE